MTEDLLDGEAERVGDQQQGAVVAVEDTAAGDEEVVGGGDGLEADWFDVDVEPRRPQHDPRRLLDLLGSSEDRHRGGPDEHPWVDESANCPGDVLQRAGVGAGHEQHGDIGRGAERLEDLPDDLADGLRGEGVLAERRGEGRAHQASGGGSSV